MDIKPTRFELELAETEQAKVLLERMEAVITKPGFGLIRRMMDGIAFESYMRMITGEKTELDKVAYCKGIIGGMEMLTQNIDSFIEECKTFIREEVKENEEEEDETIR